ncbi:PASTA domain-containing protein [Nonomuraea sp. NPDC046570]|uniref:serine/threonine-protein kinase n=1 Tax=Nonomuraea sp. NPDC046570 TaxID=3155255 RepID=UPI00340CC550
MPYAQPLRPGDPRRLGDYELSGRLGEGGQGAVFLGARGDEAFAIKLLHGSVGAESAAFLREVELAKQVARFCTAQVIDAGFDEGRPYIVGEFVDGPSLHREVMLTGPRRGGALDRLAVGTATALAAIHRAGIVHRDFKPQNVLLGPDGPRVIDFGLAKALDAAATVSGRGVGTPAYMAPEQITASAVTGAVDVFSWGATMCFAANASAPFGQDSVAPVLHRILTAQPELGRLDGALRELVLACLDKDPRNRPTSRELLLTLLGAETEAPAEVLRSPPPHVLRVEPRGLANPEGYLLGPSSRPLASPEGTGGFVPWAAGPRGPADGPTQSGRWGGNAASRASVAVSGALLVSAAVLVGVLVPALQPGDGASPVAGPTVITTEPGVVGSLGSSSLKNSPGAARRESSSAAKLPPVQPTREPAGGPVSLQVPVLAGLDRSAAEKAIKAAGLRVGGVAEVGSARPVGQVVESDPASGSLVAKGTRVGLRVSAGTRVPVLAGLGRAAAEAALATAGLKVGAVNRSCSESPGGQVIGSSPAEGKKVAPGSAVALVVARNGARVPSVVGMVWDEAQGVINGAGFSARQRAQIVRNPGDVDSVLAQSVAGGVCAKPGTSIVITVGVEGQNLPDPTEPTETPEPTLPTTEPDPQPETGTPVSG